MILLIQKFRNEDCAHSLPIAGYEAIARHSHITVHLLIQRLEAGHIGGGGRHEHNILVKSHLRFLFFRTKDLLKVKS